jgi:hypothetical protein
MEPTARLDTASAESMVAELATEEAPRAVEPAAPSASALDVAPIDASMAAVPTPVRRRDAEADVTIEAAASRPSASPASVAGVPTEVAPASLEPIPTRVSHVEAPFDAGVVPESARLAQTELPATETSLESVELTEEFAAPAQQARARATEARIDASESARLEFEPASRPTVRADAPDAAESIEPARVDAAEAASVSEELALASVDRPVADRPAGRAIELDAAPVEAVSLPASEAREAQPAEAQERLLATMREPVSARPLAEFVEQESELARLDAATGTVDVDVTALEVTTPVDDASSQVSEPVVLETTLVEAPSLDDAISLPQSTNRKPNASERPTNDFDLPEIPNARPDVASLAEASREDHEPRALEAEAARSTDTPVEVSLEANEAPEQTGTPLDAANPVLALESALDLDLALPAPAEIAENPFPQRDPEVRERLVEEHGGTRETEEAVALALAWLASRQIDDGHWNGRGPPDASPPMESPARYDFDVAMTGLATLCFLGADFTHAGDSEYRETVEKALVWLLAHQSEDGDLRGDETMYSHAIATIAICEALAMTGDPRLVGPAERAADFIVRARNPDDGGWRYDPGQAGDTSVLGWQVMALKSARRAGVVVAQEAFNDASEFLDLVSKPGSRGQYAYRPGQRATHPMTAEAMFVQQLLGVDRDHPRMRQSAEFLIRSLPDWGRNTNTYAWYYATLALFQHHGEHWQTWNEALVPALLDHQLKAGAERGSWSPGDQWSYIGGRIYQTAMCTLSLEVYYRYLPQYLEADAEAPQGESP